MKRFIFSLGVFVTTGMAMAQLPVSTDPENRNVVLEEFTGIKCVHCPDGHKKAENLRSDNPGDVVLINIHVTHYAEPDAGEPDFRTSFGSRIISLASAQGLPAGTINRTSFPQYSQDGSGGLAMSRSDWASAGDSILPKPSYVNVALEGSHDTATDELTVDVELYFTSAAPGDVNLNVALLQDNVEGPQRGAPQNPDQVLPNGKYNHLHILRHLLTGQWGEQLSITSQGAMVSKTYSYTLPDSIKNVSLSPNDLKLAAFVTEGSRGHGEVVTGAYGPVNSNAVGLEEADLFSQSSIYPNPSSSTAFIDYSLKEDANVEVKIKDMTGKLITKAFSEDQQKGSYKKRLPVQKLSKGVYIVEFHAGGQKSNKKLIIE